MQAALRQEGLRVILPDVYTSPTYEAMKRGEWPEPNPQVAEAWRRLRSLEFPVGEGEKRKRQHEQEREQDEDSA